MDVAAPNKVIQELNPIIGARQHHDNHNDDGGKVVNRAVPYSTSGPYKSGGESTGQPSSPTKSFLTQFPVVKESKQSMTTNQNSFPSKVDEKSSASKGSENEQHSSSRVAQQKQQQQQQQQDFSVFDFSETRPEMFDNSKNISGPVLNEIPELSASSQSSSNRWTSSKSTSSSKKPTSQVSVSSANVSNKQMTSAAPVVSYADKVSSVVSSPYSVSNTLSYSSQAMKGVVSNNSYPSYNISSSGNVASISSSSGNVASISSSSGKVSAQPSYQKSSGTSSMARFSFNKKFWNLNLSFGKRLWCSKINF